MAALDHRNFMQVHRAHPRSIYRRNTGPAITSPHASVDVEHHHSTAAEKGIAAAIVIVVIILLGIAAWQIGRWRRNKTRAASSAIRITLSSQPDDADAKPPAIDFDSAGREIEKPLPSLPALSIKRSSSMLMTPAPWDGAQAQSHSPPPSYAFASGNGNGSSTATRVQPPSLAIPAKPLPGHVMVPSPRSASFGVDSPLYKSVLAASTAKSAASATQRLPLPRTMAVEGTFKPSLADELPIRVGERLVLLEEYEDEWCLVQRGAGADAQKGVVPRFCLAELAS
ncbi:hypothetical protein WOLCODRAFT_101154 [Wolfiporia cocos MD-104 SS10]|uniref:SH3 domain-containing protein n=1 Tax=Wolfiporia cocos (strain MD-104) TaxID=742152 RepID=A0A2H3JIP9_WOLCO|nr:hypothetical protein WOLCODRAFT_101154 [Wolfiporia cocos MD-104 SS10]